MATQNAVLFTNSFLEYLIVFGVSIVVVIIACVIGVKLRQSKNAKIELEAVGAAGHMAETEMAEARDDDAE